MDQASQTFVSICIEALARNAKVSPEFLTILVERLGIESEQKPLIDAEIRRRLSESSQETVIPSILFAIFEVLRS